MNKSATDTVDEIQQELQTATSMERWHQLDSNIQETNTGVSTQKGAGHVQSGGAPMRSKCAAGWLVSLEKPRNKQMPSLWLLSPSMSFLNKSLKLKQVISWPLDALREELVGTPNDAQCKMFVKLTRMKEQRQEIYLLVEQTTVSTVRLGVDVQLE